MPAKKSHHKTIPQMQSEKPHILIRNREYTIKKMNGKTTEKREIVKNRGEMR
jgi:hypothetical protein